MGLFLNLRIGRCCQVTTHLFDPDSPGRFQNSLCFQIHLGCSSRLNRNTRNTLTLLGENLGGKIKKYVHFTARLQCACKISNVIPVQLFLYNYL